MRIFANCEELLSEIRRDVWEMGVIVKPNTMQNLVVKGNPDFETKEIINYSYTLLSVEDSPKFFADKESEEWVKEEFLERITKDGMGLPHNPGKAWLIRKHVWTQFLVRFLSGKEGFDYTYSERFGEHSAIQRIILEIGKNPDSRQLILSVWDRNDITVIGGKKRVPCSIFYQILVREGGIIVIYNQRSCDVVTHFFNDVYLAWELGVYIAENTGYKMVRLVHNIGSLHCYAKDFSTLQNAIDNEY